MVLCFSNNIKQRSKYWQKLTGQMLCSISGKKTFSAPHSFSAVSTSQHKVVETGLVWYGVEKGVGFYLSLSNLPSVCFFFMQEFRLRQTALTHTD